jgi:hypothetical protein
MTENVERNAPDFQTFGDAYTPVDSTQSSSLDRMLAALANERRRAVLRSLIEAPERTLDVETLTGRIAGRGGDEPVSEDRRQEARIALHHSHLPKLDAIGVLDYDSDATQVAFVGDDLAEDLLSLLGSYDTAE